MTRLYWIS
ncbi:inner membrane transport permease yadH domain protein, partial [Yersinia pestis PY-96]